MKNLVTGLMIALFTMTAAYAGECNGNSCVASRLPRRIVTLSKEVVSVPVEVTTRSVTRVRKFGRRVVCGNSCGCVSTK